MDYLVFTQDELPMENGTRQWDGCLFRETNVSIILVDAPPGGGPRLHRHPYPEVFVIHEGQALFTIGSSLVHARAGQVLIVPKGVPHKFVNTGQGRLRQTDIHPATKVQTEWLESSEQECEEPSLRPQNAQGVRPRAGA